VPASSGEGARSSRSDPARSARDDGDSHTATIEDRSEMAAGGPISTRSLH
jgi:hypothetical protein